MADVKDPSLILKTKKWIYAKSTVEYSVHKREGLGLDTKDDSIVTFSISTIESVLQVERNSKEPFELPLISHTFYNDNEYECVQIVALKDNSPISNTDFLYWATGDKYITGTVIAPLRHFTFPGLPCKMLKMGTFYEEIEGMHSLLSSFLLRRFTYTSHSGMLPTMSQETIAQLAVKV
jgi:hypothetical protein